MLIIYDKVDGHIYYTDDIGFDPSSLPLQDNQKIKVSYIQYGSAAKFLKVDPATEILMLRKGISVAADKDQINVGDTIHFTLLTNEVFEPVDIKIGSNIFNVTTNEFDVKFDYPGNYYIEVPNFDYFCLPKTIEVI
jgi:hypothetical protein